MSKIKIVSSRDIEKHPRKSLSPSDHIKQVWVVESCDPDENQHFADIVPAVNDEEAVREAELLRGRYAEGFEASKLSTYIEGHRKRMTYLESLLDNVEEAQKDWDEFIGEQDEELVRDKGGRLVREEDLEDEDEDDD